MWSVDPEPLTTSMDITAVDSLRETKPAPLRVHAHQMSKKTIDDLTHQVVTKVST